MEKDYAKKIKKKQDKILNDIVNKLSVEEEKKVEEHKINQIVDGYMKKAGIPDYWIKKRFADLKGDKDFLTTIEKLKQWDYKDPVSVSLLSNFSGNGKTHIATCIFRKYIYYITMKYDKLPEFTQRHDDFYVDACFINEGDLYYRILSTYKDKAYETEEEVIKYYCKKEFLVIDDMFSNRENEFAYRTMLYIINKRIDWNRLPTVITSNFLLNDIKDTRIKSRLQSTLNIELKKQTKITEK